MKENKIYKSGRWNRIKFLWDTFNALRKSKHFYLISIKDLRMKPDGYYQYDFTRHFNGFTVELWENFLREHFYLVKQQGDLLSGYKNILNKEDYK